MSISGDSRMKEIAARVTGMTEDEVRDLVYRASESFVWFRDMSKYWFEVKKLSDAGIANWLCYMCEHVTEGFDFTLSVQKSLFWSNTYVICGRFRFLDHPPMLPKPREFPSPTCISVQERVAGITLDSLEREMATFLKTADFSTGRAMFRDGLALGPAASIQWMIEYAFGGDNVRAEYAQKACCPRSTRCSCRSCACPAGFLPVVEDAKIKYFRFELTFRG